MIVNNSWQDNTLKQLTPLLQSYKGILAAVLIGSLAQENTPSDMWSDIDLVVVVANDSLNDFFPNSEWLQSIGSVFATSNSDDGIRFTNRVCFMDMKRIDFIFIFESSFQNFETWSYNPFQHGHRLLFSKSQLVAETLRETPEKTNYCNGPENQYKTLYDEFWFKGMLAVYKVVRNDLLIADHLALDLLRDCLVLGMMLRDRAEGTRHHRIGGIGNELVTDLKYEFFGKSASGILNSIEQCIILFNTLAQEWAANNNVEIYPLIEWVEAARETVTCKNA